MTDDMLTDSRAPTRLGASHRLRPMHRFCPPAPRHRRTRTRSIRQDRLPVAGRGYDAELLVGRVESYLNDHLTNSNLDLSHLADAAHVSPSSLGRAFRDMLDTTPWRFVMHRCINYAKTLLTDTDRSLTNNRPRREILQPGALQPHVQALHGRYAKRISRNGNHGSRSDPGRDGCMTERLPFSPVKNSFPLSFFPPSAGCRRLHACFLSDIIPNLLVRPCQLPPLADHP